MQLIELHLGLVGNLNLIHLSEEIHKVFNKKRKFSMILRK